MKDTLKSKNLWGTIGVVMTFQLIAIEQYLPHINQYLPTEYAFIGTVILPTLIVFAKILRDQGILTKYLLSLGYTNNSSDVIKDVTLEQGNIKEEVKKATKKAVKKKVTTKINKELDKVIEKL